MIDPTQVQTALGLLTAATGATGGAIGVMQQIKGMFSGNKPDDPELEALLNELAQKLTGANMLNLQLSETVKELLAAAQKQEAFESKRARYDLVKTSAGHILWQLKQDQANGEPIHYACPSCMEDGRISILQGHDEGAECTKCKQWYQIKHAPLGSYSDSGTYSVW